jgi:hypothetical protein
LYVEDLKRGTNKDIGAKDIFEMGSNYSIRLALWLELLSVIRSGFNKNAET